jgi:rhodanese-related sulfurtransferase
VPGVQLIPLPELGERHGEIPDADTVYVICKVGGRSMKAAEFLTAQGRTAVNVAGGTNAWIESGRSIESGPEAG